MPFAQTHSPFAIHTEKGSISRAAPVVQEALRQQRRKQKQINASLFAVGGLFLVGGACFILNHTAAASMESPTVATAAQPVSGEQSALVYVETPVAENPMETLEYVNSHETFKEIAEVNSVRFSGKSTKAIINGELFRIGDVVAPTMGLRFVGYDPDGEYLLFRDVGGATVFLPVRQKQAI